MKVFITWSGAKSREVGSALRDWIPYVLNNANTWMSEVDIGAGERWSNMIANELEVSKCGIICLTKANIAEPWILFEAGALAKTLEDAFVCPYLIDLEPHDLPEGPLSQFQAKRANYDETLHLMQKVNSALGKAGISEDRLRTSFNRWWPDLEGHLKRAELVKEPHTVDRTLEDMVADILDIVRGLSGRARLPESRHSESRPNPPLIFYRGPGESGFWYTEDEIDAKLQQSVDKTPTGDQDDSGTEHQITGSD